MPFEQKHLLRFGPIFSFHQTSDVWTLASYVAALQSIDRFYCFSNLAVRMAWWYEAGPSKYGKFSVNDVLWKGKLFGDNHRSFHWWCLLVVIPQKIWRGDCSASLAAKERQVMLCRTILRWKISLKRVGFLESQSKCRVWHQEHRELVSTHFWRFSLWNFNILTVLQTFAFQHRSWPLNCWVANLVDANFLFENGEPCEAKETQLVKISFQSWVESNVNIQSKLMYCNLKSLNSQVFFFQVYAWPWMYEAQELLVSYGRNWWTLRILRRKEQ